MSHNINCPECNFANTPGSKFCNNCGSKLPLSTHILCPSCSTPNTRDRVFCDHCGSRLIPDETPPEEEPEVQEPSAGSGAFTLPTKKPGETGELDPSTLPDWLRNAGKRAQDEKENADKLRIENIHGEGDQTDALPEWLVHDSDPEPIINAPTTISTEFFMDLVDKSDDLPDIDELNVGQEDDLLADAQNANLPDWLSEADAIADVTPPIEQSYPEPEEIFSDIPDSDLFDELPSAAAEQEEDEDEDESTPDWLDEPETPEDESEEEGMTHWLSDLEETGNLPEATEDEGTGLTEWLTDIDESEEEIDIFADEDEATTAVSDAEEAADEDDWLNVFEEDEDDIVEDLFSVAEDTSLSEQGDASPSLTDIFSKSEDDDDEGHGDWLNIFAEEDDDDEPTTSPPASKQKEETDWLTSIDNEPEASDAASVAHSHLTESFPEPDDSDDDWWSNITDESDAATSAPSAQFATSIPESSDDDDWWDDFTEAESAGEDEFANRINNLFDEEATDNTATDNTATDDTPETAVPEWETVTDDQFGILFDEVVTPEEDLPDWLSAAEQDSGALISSEKDDTIAESLANTQRLVENAETDWLADLDGIASDVPELSDDFLGIEEEPSVADHFTAPFSEDEHASDPDWLSDLSALDTGQLILDAEADLEEYEQEEDTAVSSESVIPIEDELPAQSIAESLPLDDIEEDESLLSMDDESIMPEWMSQLDAATDQSDNALPPLASDEELPDWIADMRPGEHSIASDIGGSLASFEPDIPETLEGLPTDLAGGDLPDWLMQDQFDPTTGATVTSFGEPSIDQNPEIPDWLKADSDDTPSTSDDNDWVSMLDDLPPSVPIASTLALAEMPEWVEELRPTELDETPSQQHAIPEGPEETEGPLAGLRGVIAIETAIVQPHQIDPVQTFTVTPEQQEQIALLQQITHEEATQGNVLAMGTKRAIAPWLRLLLTILLIGIIVLGLRYFPLAKNSFTTVSPAVVAIDEAIDDTKTTPVLIAFEYTPAYSGELSPQAEMLLTKFEDQEREILTISQYPSGTALAEIVGAPHGATNLGYLPGNAIGLRQLSDCLTGESGCRTLAGYPVEQETRRLLNNVGLVIVLTGNKDSLTNWIEQVGTDEEMLMSAGVTTSLSPSAAPYFSTKQLSGYLAGILDTAVYQEINNGQRTDNVDQLLNAQLLGQLFTAVILLMGLIIYGVRGLSNRGKS